MVRRYLFFLFLLLVTDVVFSENKLVTWAAPQGVILNDDFTVKVRQQGGKWETLST